MRALAEAGRPFRGLLYGGLMLTPDRGPMVIEWNCRFGDPETQSVLMRFDGDLLPWLAGAAGGRDAARARRARGPGVALCVVLAADGYPGQAARRRRDHRPAAASSDDLRRVPRRDAQDGDGPLVTAGGRVLGVTRVRRRSGGGARARLRRDRTASVSMVNISAETSACEGADEHERRNASRSTWQS